MSTQIERRKSTRRALVQAARVLFATNGFAGTSTEAVVRSAGMTRGALYHHFDDKTDLFAAVLEDVESELADKISGSVPPLDGPDDPGELISCGMHTFLDRYEDPDVRRIVLLEGPTVLGFERWSAIERRYGLGFLEAILGRAYQADLLIPLPLGTLAQVLFGALVEGAMLLASSSDTPTRAEVEEVLEAFIRGLWH